MEPTSLFMDDFMADAADSDLVKGCDLSFALPGYITNTTMVDFNAAEQIMARNSFAFPSNDIAGMSWDLLPSKLQHLTGDSVTVSAMDFNSEMSPAMSLCTPTANGLKSPFTFDALGLDEIGSSPSVEWRSPMDDAFGSLQSQESFDYDFAVDVSQNTIWPSQADFQLFPDNAPSVSSLQQLLMTPAPSESEIPIFKDSPYELGLDYFSPLDSAATSPTLSDCTGLSREFGAASASSANRNSGYNPGKRRRRRRITSEEHARVIPEECKDDPDARARYMCSVCGKTFSRPFNLRSHRATHAGVKPFTCGHINDEGKFCGWSFARRHDLERHTRSCHSTKKQFKCRTCGTECGRNDAFKRHLQRHAACALAALMEEEDQEMDQAGA